MNGAILHEVEIYHYYWPGISDVKWTKDGASFNTYLGWTVRYYTRFRYIAIIDLGLVMRHKRARDGVRHKRARDGVPFDTDLELVK